MARSKRNLQEYQQDILSRFRRLAEGEQAAVSSRLGFASGGVNWLVALDSVSEVLPVPDILPVPLTQAWFLGVANMRGNLCAITDFAAFTGQTPSAITADSRVLLLHHRYGANAGLLVDGLLGLHGLDAMTPQEDASPQPWQLACHTDADGRAWVELDVGALLGLDTFMQVAA
jgi:twitching motility protein PilI